MIFNPVLCIVYLNNLKMKWAALFEVIRKYVFIYKK